MKVCVFGAWHQASVAGACLAELGHEVRGTALEADALKGLSGGRAPVAEPGLNDLLRRNLTTGRLRYFREAAQALADADVALIALDTPVGEDDSPQLEPVFDAVRTVARSADGALLLVVSAQVPVGTCDAIKSLLVSDRPDLPWAVAYVPEFLRLGNAVELFLHPDRIVLGADNPAVAARVEELYQAIDAPKVRMTVRTAEMAKHASNAFLAASVSFMNEVAGLCEETGCDALAVAEAMKLDTRIGPRAFLSPGLGFAGGTLGRDIRALQAIGAHTGRRTKLLDAVMEVNQAQSRLVVERLKASIESLATAKVALLGVTYKPGTSALRRSAALETAGELLALGTRLSAHDPLVPPSRAGEVPDGLALEASAADAVEGADAVVLMTEWPEYEGLDWASLAGTMRGRLVIDARNALPPEAVRAAGLDYWGVGRAARTDRA